MLQDQTDQPTLMETSDSTGEAQDGESSTVQRSTGERQEGESSSLQSIFPPLVPSQIPSTQHTEPDAEEPSDGLHVIDWDRFEEDAEMLESDSEPDTDSLRDDLAKWMIENQLPLTACSKLLRILKEHDIDVPIDARTLAGTPRSGEVVVSGKSGGRYTYLGIAKQLPMVLKGCTPDKIVIDINIDGLPIYKSKNYSVWPVQAAVVGTKRVFKPFVVAIFGGNKPANLDFLQDTVEELKKLMSEGYTGIPFEVRYIICDAPARAMVKATIQFNGRYGCDFCDVKGIYERRMMFLYKGDARTNRTFREEDNPEHHKGKSIFLDLDIDMIQQFPIDPMHCVDLGVTKRLILYWKEGDRKHRVENSQLNVISKFNLAIRHFPTAFNRKPRSLDEVKMWKATEFRTFLLYVGPVVLKWVLPPAEYRLFLTLSVAITILCTKQLVVDHSVFADQLLNYFVTGSINRYSNKFCTYNVHCLLHLAEIAKRAEGLMNCSAYKFENNMTDIKRSVRGTTNPITQIANRVIERLQIGLTTEPEDQEEDNEKHIKLKANGEKCYLVKGDTDPRASTKLKSFVLIQEVEGDRLLCEQFQDAQAFFTEPWDSRHIGIFKANKSSTIIREFEKRQVVSEVILYHLDVLETGSQEVCLVMLHKDL